MSQHPVVWFEIRGDEHEKLQGFYGELFGWRLDRDNPAAYGVLPPPGGKGIPGGIGERGGVFNHRITFYVETEDLQASLDRAVALGGKVVTPPTPVAGIRVALFEDPEGNVVGLATP
ncbi:MAG: hypothetical protein KC766_16440 [Myxococcales bacterium]|nr:hypothetical protein [Myxococcales bacterium]